MSGAVVVVVGAASGIGRAVATRMAAAGHHVVGVDRDPAGLAETVEVLAGERNRGLVADMTDSVDLDACAAAVAEEHDRLDALVVTAGVVSTEPVDDAEPKIARKVLEVNVLGSLAAVRALLPLLRRTPGDRSVVLLSSVAGSLGGGLLGTSVYAASKAAVEGLARGLARELAADGIRVNAVAPGPVDTPLLDAHLHDTAARDRLAASTLLGRRARPDEVAAAIEFLVGPASSYITGQVLHANGGGYFG